MKTKGMKRFAGRIGMAALFAVTAALGSEAALAQIANTKHNLTAAGPGTVKLTTGAGSAGTEEICVFCHTPHGASSSAGGPPIWNKALPSAASFTTYRTTTLDSTVDLTGAPSLACLSCHDGVSALDNIVNAPGSGGWNAAGANLAWTWAGGSDVMPAGITRIGTDLTNDHPVGMNYCGHSAADTATGALTCGDTDFHVTTGPNNNVKFDATKVVWWVQTAAGATNAARDKQDLPLYTRTINSVQGPTVECQTCHDPHVSSANGTSGETFLRIPNTGSALCLTCHVK